MPNNIWSSPGSTDGNLSTNWSLGTVPASGDTMYLDATSVIDCIFTADISCDDLVVAAGYTGTFDKNNKNLTFTVGGFVFNATGATLLIGDAGLIKINGDFIVANISGNDHNQCPLQYTADGDLGWSDSQGTGNSFLSMDIDSGVTVTLLSGVQFRNDSGTSATCIDGTCTIDIGNNALTFNNTGTNISPLVLNGSSVVGTGSINFQPQSGVGIIIELPDTSIDFEGGINCKAKTGVGNTVIFNLNADITCRNLEHKYDISAQTGFGILECGAHNLTISNNLSINGSQGAANSGTVTNNMGSGTHVINNLLILTDIASTAELNLESCAMSVATDVDMSDYGLGTFNFDAGTSVFTFGGTSNQNFTSDVNTFYDVVVANIGGGLTLVDALDCNTLVVTSGDFDQNGQEITSVSDIAFDGTGIITLDALITMSGDGDFHIGSTISSLTVTGCSIDLKGVVNYDIDKEVDGLMNFTGGYAGKIISFIGSASTLVSGVATIAHSTGTLLMGGTSATPLVLTGTGTPLVSNNGLISHAGFKTILFLTLSAGSVSVDIPNTTTGIIVSMGSAVAGTVTYTLVAAIGGMTGAPWRTEVRTFLDNALCKTIFNTANYDIDCTYAFHDYNVRALAIKESNYGSSVITTPRYTQGVPNGQLDVNFQTSTWNVDTDFTISAAISVTVDPGTFQLNLDGTGAQTLTSGGHALYEVIEDNSGGGLTLQDALDCNTLVATNGGFDQNGQTIDAVSAATFNNVNDIVILDAQITFSADATLTFAVASTGSLTTTDCDITFLGTGTSTFQQDYASQQQFNDIKGGNGPTALLNYQSTLTSTTSSWNSYENLHATGECNYGKKIRFTGAIPWINNNGTWSGTNNTEWKVPNTTCTLNLPAIHTDLTLIATNDVQGASVINQQDAFDGVDLRCTTNALDADWTWNTLSNNITTSGGLVFDSSNTSADGILNAGASDITCSGNLQLLSTSSGGSIYNLGSGTWKFAGDCTIDWTAGTFNADTSTFEANGTGAQAITFSDQTLNILKNSNTTSTLDFLDASHAARWDFAPNTIIRFKDGVTHTLNNYTTGDIDGTAGNLVTLKSLVDTVAWLFDNPASMAVSYVDVRDSTATLEVDASDGTNVDSTGNTNWTFVSAGVTGSGDLTTEESTIAGAGLVSKVGQGALATEASELTGEGVVFTELPGTGTLTTEESELAGAGDVHTDHFGTGDLVAGRSSGFGGGFGGGFGETNGAIIVGIGFVSADLAGSGALTSTPSELSGAGFVYTGLAGSGALTSDESELSGVGTVIGNNVGSGTLTTLASELSGDGYVYTDIAGSGDLITQPSELSGAGEKSANFIGSGALTSMPSELVGIGYSNADLDGSGALVSLPSELAGAGYANTDLEGFGALASPVSEISGLGSYVTGNAGSGLLMTESAILHGIGTVESFHSGAGKKIKIVGRIKSNFSIIGRVDLGSVDYWI